VRVFFLKAKNQFTLHRVNPGHYDVRYLNLDTGLMRQSPAFETTVTKMRQYEGWTILIYDDPNGTIFHREIGKDEF
jgi:hypothetical protein